MDYVAFYQSLRSERLWKEVEDRLARASHAIVETEEFSSAMVETNAQGYEIIDTKIRHVEVHQDDCRIAFNFQAQGEHDWNDNKTFCGDRISGQATALIDRVGHVTFDGILCSKDDDGPEEDYE